jgi:hypothetical protein
MRYITKKSQSLWRWLFLRIPATPVTMLAFLRLHPMHMMRVFLGMSFILLSLLLTLSLWVTQKP